MTSWLSDTSANKVVKTYVNGFMDCSGYFLNRVGNVMIGNVDYPGYNANQRSLLVNGRTLMNGNLTINGNISVNSPNIALGLDAGSITVGTNTVAIGNQAGRSNLGADSVAIGYNTSVAQLGSQSVAVGTYSGYNQQGANNTFLGHKAGYNAGSVMTGGNNIYIGFNTTANNSAYNNSTAIGSGASITASNQIVLGTANETVTVPGKLAINVAAPLTKFHINTGTDLIVGTFPNYNGGWASGAGLALAWNYTAGNGHTGYLCNGQNGPGGHEFWRVNNSVNTPAWASVYAASYPGTSDYRIKENVINIKDSLYDGLIDKIRPVYYYNTHLAANCFGLIAHEVQEVYPDMVHGEKDAMDKSNPPKERHQSLDYTQFVAILIKEVQDLRKIVKIQDELISNLEARLSTLENK